MEKEFLSVLIEAGYRPQVTTEATSNNKREEDWAFGFCPW